MVGLSLKQESIFEKENIVHVGYDGTGNSFALTLEEESLMFSHLSNKETYFSVPTGWLGPGSEVTAVAVGAAVQGSNLNRGQLFLAFSNRARPRIG